MDGLITTCSSCVTILSFPPIDTTSEGLSIGFVDKPILDTRANRRLSRRRQGSLVISPDVDFSTRNYYNVFTTQLSYTRQSEGLTYLSPQTRRKLRIIGPEVIFLLRLTPRWPFVLGRHEMSTNDVLIKMSRSPIREQQVKSFFMFFFIYTSNFHPHLMVGSVSRKASGGQHWQIWLVCSIRLTYSLKWNLFHFGPMSYITEGFTKASSGQQISYNMRRVLIFTSRWVMINHEELTNLFLREDFTQKCSGTMLMICSSGRLTFNASQPRLSLLRSNSPHSPLELCGHEVVVIEHRSPYIIYIH